MTINAPAALLLLLLRARRRGAGRAGRGAARHRAERRPQGVRRARELHLPAAAVDAARRPTSSRTARSGSRTGTRSRSPATTSARRARRAAQELAFTLANGIAYCEAAVAAGLSPDDFGERLSFFFNAHNHFFQEVAKFRAARRLWARIMRDRFGATNPKAQALRFHAQTGGSTLTAQQPENNVVRVAIQALSAVCGGAQSLHTNALRRGARAADRARRDASRSARSRSSLHEAGTTDTADPLGGSYFVESLTDELEARAHGADRADRRAGRRRRGDRAGLRPGARSRRRRSAARREVESGRARRSSASTGSRPTSREHVDAPPARPGDRARASASGPRACARSATPARSRPPLAEVRRRRRRRRRTSSRRCARRCRARCTIGEICGALRELWGTYDAQRCVAVAPYDGAVPRRSRRAASSLLGCRARGARRPGAARAGVQRSAPAATAAAPSFARDVAPIVREKCPGCHRTAGSRRSPFRTERDLASSAALIVAARHSASACRRGRRRRARPQYVGQARAHARPRASARRIVALGASAARPRRRGPPRHPGRRAADPGDRGPAGRDAPRARDARRLPPVGGEGRRRTTTAASSSTRSSRGRVRHLGPDRARAQPSLVHHVILFRVPQASRSTRRRRSTAARPARAGRASAAPASAAGRAAARADSLDDASWIAAWAPGWGGRPAPGRHRHRAARREPDRDAGALQPPERQRARIARARVLTTVPGDRGLDAGRDDAPPRPRRARVREGRERAALRPDGGASSTWSTVRRRRGASSRRASSSSAAGTPRGRCPSAVSTCDRPHRPADHDPGRRQATCTCSDARSGSS